MSKVIRPVRISRNFVTLGQAESGLYLGDDAAVGIDLAALVARRAGDLQTLLEGEWSEKLQGETRRLEDEYGRQHEESRTEWEGQVAETSQTRYQEGYAAGVAAKEEEVREALARLESLHDQLAAQRSRIVREAEELVVEVAVELGRRITGIQAETDPKVLARVMRRALENLASTGEIILRVHPDDLDLARRFAAHWTEKVEKTALLKVRPGAHVGRGGCMVEGGGEHIDARLESQFSVLGEALRQAIEGETDEIEADESEAGDE